MAKGLTSIEGAQADIEARKAAGAAGGATYFKLAPGETATVRFLEQGDDLAWAWVHELKPEKGKSYGKKVPCRDQGEDGERIGAACPGCDEGLTRTFQGVINMIWRNGPVYEKDENNRVKKNDKNQPIIESRADVLTLWTSGITVFGALAKKDAKYKGLKSRDFEITRDGEGLSTKYIIEPADPDAGPQEMSTADTELASEKPDLIPMVTPPAYESWGKTPSRKQEDDVQPSETGPFSRRRD